MSLLRQLLVTQPMSAGPLGDAYRKSHEIEGAASEQTNYQVKIKVSYAEGGWSKSNLTEIVQASCVLSDGVTLLAAHKDGKIYKSEDDGLSFLHISTLPDEDGVGVPHMFCAANGYVYALLSRGVSAKGKIYRSVDNGENWTTVCTTEVNGETFWNIAEDSGGYLYASGWNAPEELGHAKIFRSIDNGGSWSKVYTFDIATYRHCHEIAVNPHTDWIYVCLGDQEFGGAGIARSKDCGISWAIIYGGVYPPAGSFQKTALIFKGNDNYIWAGEDWGTGAVATIARAFDDGGASVSFSTIWSVGYKAVIFWMRETFDGKLVIGAASAPIGSDVFIAISDDANWDSFTILETITVSGAWQDSFRCATDRFSDNRILLCSRWESGSDTVGRSISYSDLGENVYLDGKCRTDFGDVRFRQGETKLDYWPEEQVDSDYAVFWVEVPTIPVTGTTIYVYYGKADAVSEGDGIATFIFFEPFDDLDDWDDLSGAGCSVSIVDGKLHSHCDADAGAFANIRSKSSWAGSICIRRKAYIDNRQATASTVFWGATVRAVDDKADGLGSSVIETNAFKVREWAGGVEVDFVDDVFAPSVDVDYILETMLFTDKVRAIYHTVTVTNPSANYTATAHKVKITDSAWAGSISPTDVYYYWLAIRKWVDPEPSHGAWGSEEAVVWPF